MKSPLKANILPFLTLGAGALGIGLRVWLYSSGLDKKGLFITGHPSITLLFILTGLVLLLSVLCVLPLTRSPSYNKLFPPSLFAFAGCLIGGAGIVATNVLHYSQRNDAVTLVCLIAGILAAICLLYVGFCRFAGIRPGFLFRGIITAYFMLHIVSQYRFWSAEPQLQVYFFPLMASVFLMLSAYQRTTLDAGMGIRRWYVFTNQATLFFCLVCTVGQNGLFYLSMGLWTLTELCSLKRVRPHKASMQLPEAVRYCISTLEHAGYQAYAVGGCVRDMLLGIAPHDYDLCTNAMPEVIADLFGDHRLVRNGEKHGTVGVIIDHKVYEITTFRTEGGYSDSRHPDWVAFVSSIDEDLARRDFTVNAMAYNPRTGFVDPWGGRQDLEQQILRAVGDPETRFTEDALRILRGVRFSVRFGLTPDPQTAEAMFTLAPLLDNLARERVFDELCKLIVAVKPEDLLRFAPILAQTIPALRPCIDFQQHSPYHAYDVYTHTAYVTGNVAPVLALRWAALLHDVGKPATFTTDENGQGHFTDHARIGAEIAAQTLFHLKAPTALREQVVFLIEHHMSGFEPDKKLLRRRLGKYGKENCALLLDLQQADFCSKGTQSDLSEFIAIRELLAQIDQEDSCMAVTDLAINGRDLIDLGYAPGPEIGRVLAALLECVQDEILTNTKEELLNAAQQLKD